MGEISQADRSARPDAENAACVVCGYANPAALETVFKILQAHNADGVCEPAVTGVLVCRNCQTLTGAEDIPVGDASILSQRDLLIKLTDTRAAEIFHRASADASARSAAKLHAALLEKMRQAHDAAFREPSDAPLFFDESDEE